MTEFRGQRKKRNVWLRRLPAVLLSVCLMVSCLSDVWVFAEETAPGLCEHHPVHTEDCGYQEGAVCSYVCEWCGNGGDVDGESGEESGAEPETKAESEPEAEPGTESESETELETESEAQTEAQREPEAQTESKAGMMSRAADKEIVSWKWADADVARNELLGWNEATKQWEATVHMNANISGSRVKEILNGPDGLLPSQIEAELTDGTKETVALDWGPLLSAISDADTTGSGWDKTLVGEILPPGYSCLGTTGMRAAVRLVRPTKFLNNWEFEEREGTELKEHADGSQWMEVYPLSLDEPDVMDALDKVLPERIYGEGFDLSIHDGKGGFQFKGPLNPAIPQVANACGYLPVTWMLDRLEGTDFQDGGTYVLRAAYNPYWGINGGVNGAGDLLNTYLEFSITLHALNLDEHIETEKVSDPEATTVNLFDYWVQEETPTAPNGDILSKSDWHVRQNGNREPLSAQNDWNTGINQGHLLIFGDGLIHAGLWNKGAGEMTDYGKAYAGMEEIVEPVLSGDGYPVINTKDAKLQLNGDQTFRDWVKILDYRLAGDHVGAAGAEGSEAAYDGSDIQNLSNTVIGTWGKDLATEEESLDYLFDPQKSHPNKKNYQNVTGLFQLDDDGYYYYNMRDNFAEFVNDPKEGSDGYFKLYDAGATTRTDGQKSIGNFFPFNTGEEVFTGVDAQGKLTSAVECARNSMNHHLGMTVEIDFRQPVDGMVNAGTSGSEPMTFGFSGDDDVWVYIDDVLVLDLGGVHSEIYGTIDFSTGEVCIGRAFNSKGIPEDPTDPANLVTDTTLQDLYAAAGKAGDIDWKDGVPTFASNSDHKLKMFYLERGNYDSSIALRFNLQPRLYQQIKKVDQDGNPIAGVEFDLYEAKENADGTYKAAGNALARLRTEADGTAQFTEVDPDGTIRPFNFSDRVAKNIQTYILKEVSAPPGYRSLPEDIVFEYDPDTTHLLVINRWTTGAYANFVELISGNSEISYGSFDQNGNINPSSNQVSRAVQKNGLVFAIPMLYQKGTGKWQALYGSNTEGLHTETPKSMDVEAWRKAALTAMVHQCADRRESSPHWYLEWNESRGRLEGTLNDLPGRTDRYLVNNPVSGDMKMAYAIILPEVFDAFHISAGDSQSRYEALGVFINQELESGKTIAEVVDEIYNVPSTVGQGLSFLNVDQFIRNVRSVIYVPNERRELQVWKLDQDGKGVNGTSFGLYENETCSGTPIALGETATVDGKDGVLIFSPSVNDFAGHATMAWGAVNTRYYLKELRAPEGYRLNDTVVPVVVGAYSIYADAGSADDGISVMAGVGKLAETLTKHAADEEVDITLRDITATGQIQGSEGFVLNGWQDMMLAGTRVPRVMNLHYGMNAESGYGLHDEDGGKTIRPFLITDNGFIRVRVQQNYRALTGELHGSASIDTNKEDLGDTDITSLFSLLNIVVVTDRTETDTRTGQLAIRKMVRGDGLSEEDYTRMFSFAVTLQDANGRTLPGRYHFYGTDKSGFIESGGVIPLHHDESITILGLPEGAKYQVREVPVAGWHSIPASGTASGNILAEGIATENFVNTNTTLEMGELRIQKTVTGGGDRRRSFTFEVRFLDEDGTEPAESYPYMGSAAGTIKSGGQVTLRHNEHVTVTELPAGTYYVVTELEANQDGYQTSSTDESGTVLSGWEMAAKFVNYREEDPGTASDPGTDPDQNLNGSSNRNPNGASDPGGSGGTSVGGGFRSTRPTAAGDNSHPALWWSILCSSFVVLAAVCAACRRQESGRRKRRSR